MTLLEDTKRFTRTTDGKIVWLVDKQRRIKYTYNISIEKSYMNFPITTTDINHMYLEYVLPIDISVL